MLSRKALKLDTLFYEDDDVLCDEFLYILAFRVFHKGVERLIHGGRRHIHPPFDAISVRRLDGALLAESPQVPVAERERAGGPVKRVASNLQDVVKSLKKGILVISDEDVHALDKSAVDLIFRNNLISVNAVVADVLVLADLAGPGRRITRYDPVVVSEVAGAGVVALYARVDDREEVVHEDRERRDLLAQIWAVAQAARDFCEYEAIATLPICGTHQLR